MKVVARAVVLLGGLLLAVLAASCGSVARGPARGSVPACTGFGVRAIQQRLTPARIPPACQGLSRAEVNFALGRAIFLAAGSGRHKAAWRREASVAGARLGRLITALPPSAASSPGGSGETSAAARPAPVNRRPLGLAALLGWLMTVGIGVVMLGRPSVGGMLHQMRARRGRAAPAVLAGHSGLATTALLVWACYLATGWLALAWLAVCLLLPVIGLGMAVLTIGTAAASRPAGGAPVLRAGRRRRGAILPIVHGLAAMATILLALLTALGAG
jgi:hypothetical protein